MINFISPAADGRQTYNIKHAKEKEKNKENQQTVEQSIAVIFCNHNAE